MFPLKAKGAMCKEYNQLSITSPNLEHCVGLVVLNTARGACGAGSGIFSYGKVTNKHLECACCKADSKSALKNMNRHKAFNTYKILGKDEKLDMKEEPKSVAKYIGCFLDKGNRDLPVYIREAERNPEKCFDAARKRGLKYVGLQNGSQCFAGNKFGKHGKRNRRECRMKCGKGKECGSGWRNSIY